MCKDLKAERWREICLYHKHDFQSMLTEEESNEPSPRYGRNIPMAASY
jgi:hypothetical protein